MEIIIGFILLLNLITLGWLFKSNKEQKLSNIMLEDDVISLREALLSLQNNFTNYQVEVQRDLDNVVKSSTKDTNSLDRKINRINSELPTKIRKVVGHIEFARPIDKKLWAL